MSGESETNAHDRREVGVTTLPMTDVSSASGLLSSQADFSKALSL